ncbi:hypothetical protein [Pseudobacteroides cellulosolvens]|uniref:Uncharacterized protein n=1 Tax=Pseudobacteroides cellulosolvens ATCC 35603 = DSM 2933 TaxID=398512 RepID=A0A0L6JW29_9FIRM|nr:hypothetical protein [Pseudobacteroides cellulosolvens]KNY29815.1 hypothetical protein Bccel_5092 [Pseudobacteroides cellulosolvens ATCC 35603 = DSM 2933]
MISSNNEMRSLKGYILSELLTSKKNYIIGASIILANLLLSTMIEIIMLSLGQNSSNNGGVLTVGFGVAFIVMFIYSIILPLNKSIKTKFIFPINRKIYTIGNLVSFYINTFILLIVTCSAYLLELLTSMILKSVYKNFVYINKVTFEVYAIGFLISLLYIVAFTAFSYMLFVIISRYGLKSIVTISVATIFLLLFPFGRNMIFKSIMFFIGEQSSLLLAIKLIACTLVFQLLSYIPIKSMEVNK